MHVHFAFSLNGLPKLQIVLSLSLSRAIIATFINFSKRLPRPLSFHNHKLIYFQYQLRKNSPSFLCFVLSIILLIDDIIIANQDATITI